MENASKALIIAGAILVTIIIISLGIMVVNNARNSMGDTSLSKEKNEAFNSQWSAYFGDKRTASDVQSLCSAAIASNAAEKASGTARYIEVSGAGISIKETGSATTTTVPALSTAKTYKVVLSASSNGATSKITVTAN